MRPFICLSVGSRITKSARGQLSGPSSSDWTQSHLNVLNVLNVHLRPLPASEFWSKAATVPADQKAETLPFHGTQLTADDYEGLTHERLFNDLPSLQHEMLKRGHTVAAQQAELLKEMLERNLEDNVSFFTRSILVRMGFNDNPLSYRTQLPYSFKIFGRDPLRVQQSDRFLKPDACVRNKKVAGAEIALVVHEVGRQLHKRAACAAVDVWR
jgi:hypothetical protein